MKLIFAILAFPYIHLAVGSFNPIHILSLTAVRGV